MAATATAPVLRLPPPVTATAPVLRLCLRGRPTEDLLGRDATKLAGNQLDWTGIASDELSIAPAFALLTMIVLRSAARFCSFLCPFCFSLCHS